MAVEIEGNGLVRVQQQREALAEGDVALQGDGIALGARQAQRLRQAFGGGDVVQFARISGSRKAQRAAVHVGEQHLRAVPDFTQGYGGGAVRKAQPRFPTAAIRDVAVALNGESARFEAGDGSAVCIRSGGNGDALQAT